MINKLAALLKDHGIMSNAGAKITETEDGVQLTGFLNDIQAIKARIEEITPDNMNLYYESCSTGLYIVYEIVSL